MTRIKYDASLMKLMTVFEQITGTKVKDCFVDENGVTMFIVAETQIGRAIGRKGSNVRMLEKALNRKIKIVEFNPRIGEFIKNLIYPIIAKDIQENGDQVTILGQDTASKGILIGRNGKNLKNLTGIAKRHFPIQKIEVR
ncbi:MAG: NusA-like transcription termination signal-binding factor [Nanoarchaeota archaeon]|nr:NusA-like transcription termination signal-binding factor [Nanoarchaeota archaeon]